MPTERPAPGDPPDDDSGDYTFSLNLEVMGRVTLTRSSLIDNEFVIGYGNVVRQQRVIAEGKSLQGMSWQRSKLIKSGTLGLGDHAYVKNANYGAGGTQTPLVSDITIDCGENVARDGSDPYTFGGVWLDGMTARIERTRILNVNGVAAKVTRTDAGSHANWTDQFRLEDLDITHSLRAIEIDIPDVQIFKCAANGFRDHGLYVGTQRSNCQLSGSHFYGSGDHDAGRPGSGSCVYVLGTAFQSVGNKYGDCAQCAWLDGSAFYSGFNGDHFFKFWRRGVLNETGKRFSAKNCYMDVPQQYTPHPEIVGYDIFADGCRIEGGRVLANWFQHPNLTGTWTYEACEAAVRIHKTAHDTVIDTHLDLNPNVANQVGVEVLDEGGTVPAAMAGRITLNIFGATAANGSVGLKLPSTIKGYKIEVYGRSGQNLIDIPAGWDESNRITWTEYNVSTNTCTRTDVPTGTAL